MAPDDHEAFILPDISEATHRADHDTSLSPEERLQRRRALELEFATKSEQLNIIHQLLRAHALYERDVNYGVQDGEVLIVDEFTGRTMPGRRWSEGLHQAVEAKENVRVKGETQTLATITIQNYFRMYDKLAGMTGTAETEEREFFEIYKLEVAVVPTNRPIIRDDRQDLVYKTRREKYNAIVEETRRLHDLGFPVLIRYDQCRCVGNNPVQAVPESGGWCTTCSMLSTTSAKQKSSPAAGQSKCGHDRHQHGGPRYGYQNSVPVSPTPRSHPRCSTSMVRKST